MSTELIIKMETKEDRPRQMPSAENAELLAYWRQFLSPYEPYEEQPFGSFLSTQKVKAAPQRPAPRNEKELESELGGLVEAIKDTSKPQ